MQSKKREKHPWRSVNFSTKSNTPSWMFFTFFKLYKWYQITQRITNILQLHNVLATNISVIDIFYSFDQIYKKKILSFTNDYAFIILFDNWLLVRLFVSKITFNLLVPGAH